MTAREVARGWAMDTLRPITDGHTRVLEEAGKEVVGWGEGEAEAAEEAAVGSVGPPEDER